MTKETENKEEVKIAVASATANVIEHEPAKENPVVAPIPPKYMEHLKSAGSSIVRAVDTSIRLVLLGKVDEEIEEVASKSRGPIIFGLWVSIMTLFVGGGWMCFAPLNSASHSQGVIVLESNKHTVQILDNGIVDQVLVKTGDIVKKDQPLIILSNANIKASHDSALNQIYQNKAAIERLEAERDDKDEVTFDAELLQKAVNDPEINKVLDTQRRIFTAKKDTITSQLSGLNERIAQDEKSIEGAHAQELAYDEQVKLAQSSVNAAKLLLTKGNIRRNELMARESELARLMGTRAEQVSRQDSLKQHINETKSAILTTKADKFNKIVEELKETSNKLVNLQESYKAAADQLSRTTIKSPADGVVNNVDKSISVGSVLSPQHPIMEIIPQNDKLVVDARATPLQIDNIHIGMITKINVSAFKTRNLPPIMGKVIRVSPDLVIDRNAPQMGGYFEVRIEVDQESLAYIEKKYRKLNLQTGMTADVTIINGTRTMMQYLLSPITDTFQKAFTEK